MPGERQDAHRFLERRLIAAQLAILTDERASPTWRLRLARLVELDSELHPFRERPRN